jgi:hypothetical protein
MPLVLDPNSLSLSTLEELWRSLRNDLEETREFVDHPPGPVTDPASIESARELLRSTIARLDVPGPRDVATLAVEANLAYATLVAVIDLVKSHADVPRVPRKRAPE